MDPAIYHFDHWFSEVRQFAGELPPNNEALYQSLLRSAFRAGFSYGQVYKSDEVIKDLHARLDTR